MSDLTISEVLALIAAATALASAFGTLILVILIGRETRTVTYEITVPDCVSATTLSDPSPDQLAEAPDASASFSHGRAGGAP